MSDSRSLVALSGGMDSAVTLVQALCSSRREVCAVGFCYPSKHNRWERVAAAKLAARYVVPFETIDLSLTMADFKSDLLVMGEALPEGHYEEESMRRTVVPGRNSIFASILLGYAQSRNFHQVWLGIHAGDHHIYPDCRPQWVTAMASVYREASENTVALLTPFLYSTKADILKKGLEFRVPFELTRTCYTQHEIACGRCGSCQERLEAFYKAGVEDPLAYTSRELMPKSK